MSDSLKLRIDARLAEQIRRHGAEAYPNECCGALLGRETVPQGMHESSREVVALLPLINRRDDSPRNRFSVAAKDVLKADRAAQAQGLELVGWYHSHPDHPARPSSYDREHAWPWYSYVIVRVQNGIPEEMTSWRLEDDRGEYSEETLVHAASEIPSN